MSTVRQREAVTELLDQFLLAVRRRTTHQLQVRRVVQFVAELRRCLLPRNFVQGLGIEHQSVHVEDHGGDPWRALHWRQSPSPRAFS